MGFDIVVNGGGTRLIPKITAFGALGQATGSCPFPGVPVDRSIINHFSTRKKKFVGRVFECSKCGVTIENAVLPSLLIS